MYSNVRKSRNDTTTFTPRGMNFKWGREYVSDSFRTIRRKLGWQQKCVVDVPRVGTEDTNVGEVPVGGVPLADGRHSGDTAGIEDTPPPDTAPEPGGPRCSTRSRHPPDYYHVILIHSVRLLFRQEVCFAKVTTFRRFLQSGQYQY